MPIDTLLALLCERFPRTFFRYEGRRRPLKLGIHKDILAALGDEIDPKALSHAIRVYCGHPAYLRKQTAGTARIDLNGDVAGAVTAEHVARAKERLAGIVARRKPKAAKAEVEPRLRSAAKTPETGHPAEIEAPTAPPPRPRLTLASLREAAFKRKAQAAA